MNQLENVSAREFLRSVAQYAVAGWAGVNVSPLRAHEGITVGAILHERAKTPLAVTQGRLCLNLLSSQDLVFEGLANSHRQAGQAVLKNVVGGTFLYRY